MAAQDLGQEGSGSPLVRLLDVEALEQDYFRGIATPGGTGRSFGGQVIAQAMMAAMRTAEPGRTAHSLHAYFMRPGRADGQVLYQVFRDMDGRSFSTRRVVAIQGGRPILNMAASFQVPQDGLDHTTAMPDVPGPEEVEDEVELIARHGTGIAPESYRDYIGRRLIELRPVELPSPYSVEPRAPVQHMWFRAKGPLGDNLDLHRAALAYTSDMGLLPTALLPHSIGFHTPGLKMASLDHALWLHDDFRMDDWLLYATDSPWAGAARGYTRGRIFARDGRLVASVAQEGMLRPPSGEDLDQP